MTDEERFWARVQKGDGCWLWTGGQINNGYGKFFLTKRGGGVRYVRAHRYSWTLANGAIPDGLYVLHACDNPPCVNPAHLFLGTQGDNTRDMRIKGRGVSPPRHLGADNFKAKLDKAAVLDIWELLRSGISAAEIGRRYGVSQGTIADIRAGRSWTWLNEDPRLALGWRW